MRIATVATGGIGGFLAVRLVRIGLEVACIARGAHLEAIRNRGLRLESSDGIEMVMPWRATSDPVAVGPVDIVILAVKAGDLDKAAALCRPLIGSETVIVPFLNGVETLQRLRRHLPAARIADGVAHVAVTLREPGLIQQTGEFARFLFAFRDDASPSRKLRDLRLALRKAGLEAPESADIRRDVWTKFIFFAALSGLTAASRCDLGAIRNHPESAALFRDAMAEVDRVGRARGVALAPDVLARQWHLAEAAPAALRASTAIDLAEGRPLETPWINGAVVRLSEAAGFDAPVNRALAALLAPRVAGNPAGAEAYPEKKRVSSM